MSIRRSGVFEAEKVECIKSFQYNNLTIQPGQKLELVLDMGMMYMVKIEDSFKNIQEIVVPKDHFQKLT